MHLILAENEVSETDKNFNKYENMFCAMDRLDKKRFIEKWKSINSLSEFKYSVGRVYSNKETNIIDKD